TGPTVHPDELERIIERSGGNPFFVRELVAATHKGDAALPASIEAVLRERLNALEDDDRLLLAHASAIGRSFDLELLRKTLAGTELVRELDERVPNLVGFVEEVLPDRFQFRH